MMRSAARAILPVSLDSSSPLWGGVEIYGAFMGCVHAQGTRAQAAGRRTCALKDEQQQHIGER